MTRKTALLKAISYIEQLDENDETDAIRKKLQEILEELPLMRWSSNTILDTLEQWATDHGRNPVASDLRGKGMPPHSVIKLRFDMHAKEFLDQHFPRAEIPKEYWKTFFMAEYESLSRPGSAEYNKLRKAGTPGWPTIAKRFGITRWSDWLAFCGLETGKGSLPGTRGIRIRVRSHFLDEIERLWSKEKIGEFFPSLTCEVLPSEREDMCDVFDVLEDVREIREDTGAG